MLILIPAYQPTLILVDLVKKIKENITENLDDLENRFEILVIDDGSTNIDSEEVFRSLELMKNVTVLHHPNNRGKGAALKTGLAYALESNVSFVVTADADGQHCPDDIGKLFKYENDLENLVLSVRTFAKDTPFRSRIGNLITGFVFRLIHRVNVEDTQTGLITMRVRYSSKIIIAGSILEYHNHPSAVYLLRLKVL